MPYSWERTQQRDPHKNSLGGIFGVKKGVPNGPFSATKSLVYCFLFLPLFIQDTFDHDKGQRSAVSGPSPLEFLNFLHGFLSFLSRFSAIQEGNRPKVRRKLPDFRAEKKARAESYHQAPKKGINIKNFARNSPPRPPPPKGTPDPVSSLCLGAPFPSKYRKKPKHKEFFGGGLRGPKILYAEILYVFYFCLISRLWLSWFCRSQFMDKRFSGHLEGGTCI